MSNPFLYMSSNKGFLYVDILYKSNCIHMNVILQFNDYQETKNNLFPQLISISNLMYYEKTLEEN